MPDVNQCEVVYVNHIDPTSASAPLGTLAEILTLVRIPERRELLPGEPEISMLNVRYAMPDQRGRLHIAAQPAIRRSDGKAVIQVTLTARGRPASSRTDDILAWLDGGHDWIVHGFVDITTERMHKLWGRL